MHVVIASRGALPIPTARLHQDNELLAFDATDLALTADETAGWLRNGSVSRVRPGSDVAGQPRRVAGSCPCRGFAGCALVLVRTPALEPAYPALD